MQSVPCKPKLRQLSMSWTIPPTLHNEEGTASQLLSHLVGTRSLPLRPLFVQWGKKSTLCT